MGRRVLAAVLLLGVVAFGIAAVAHAEGHGNETRADVNITLSADAAPAIEQAPCPGDGGCPLTTVTLVNETPGQHASFHIDSEQAKLIVRVVSDGYFDVERARQMVPEVDDRFFFEVPSSVAGRDPSARVVQVRSNATDQPIEMDLVFPVVNGTARLNLTRDVEAPGFELGPATELGPHRFHVRSETTEYALATLWVEPVDGSRDPVEFPTPVPALIQRFPVQGLEPGTTYTYYVEFEDWAGNEARSEDRSVTTPSLPEVEGPVVEDVAPPAGASLPQAPAEITASFATPVGTIEPSSHVRLFVDKKEVTGQAERTASWVRYVPAEGFGPGFHSVGLELMNSEGGKTVHTWNFTVEEPAASPGAGALASLAGLAMATALATWRTGGGRRP